MESDDAGDAPADASPTLAAGAVIDVRNRFDGRWAHGFEVVAADDGGYRVRRLSDGRELPSLFDADDVRPRERKRGTWWY
jgi:hypothetical protein